MYNCCNSENSQQNLKSSATQKCEGKSVLGFDRIEAGWKYDCKSRTFANTPAFLSANDAFVYKWDDLTNDETRKKIKIQSDNSKKICDGLYNAPWIGERVICNGTPSHFWGTSDCSFVPDNGGETLCWQCQPGDKCTK
jgi:hypothetical protein